MFSYENPQSVKHGRPIAKFFGNQNKMAAMSVKDA